MKDLFRGTIAIGLIAMLAVSSLIFICYSVEKKDPLAKHSEYSLKVIENSLPKSATAITHLGNGWVLFTLAEHTYLFYKTEYASRGYTALARID